VDGDDGVSLDAVSDITRVVSDVLDSPDGTEVMGEQPYVLEVSSPGVGRPLTMPRHWRRNRDRKVKLTTTEGRELTSERYDYLRGEQSNIAPPERWFWKDPSAPVLPPQGTMQGTPQATPIGPPEPLNR